MIKVNRFVIKKKNEEYLIELVCSPEKALKILAKRYPGFKIKYYFRCSIFRDLLVLVTGSVIIDDYWNFNNE